MRITYDIDGVIIPLIETICRKHGIDFNKITEYSISKCDRLTKKEKSLIYREFTNVEIFRAAGIYDGALDINEIAQRNDVFIDSNNVVQDIAFYKAELINRIIPSVKDIKLSVSIKGKDFKETDIVVEDCVANLLDNIQVYRAGILITRPWNTSFNERDHSKIIRVNSLVEANSIIKSITYKE